ncbi:nucleoside hydrolase [Kaistia geumhonensis]|uniref:Inosine-uridine nucleoside N-ribohydrolase n=1 Tax=Kaistia geumhonensis TaxID=410839 RepID=A0ABU0MA08_9HYPH|nr:nucleoside hydrolase [Kaistia geumhonensis]MCX5480492.1 nucleoside hydrolase [Kaistia geumhonensis]MDQ0517808.1 inosine-uridine nucleoside N-ribohydrolase [Kaistia geumhonensis]
METIKVIFDTDPGVDDAMALLFLHRAPQVEIVGVTTTFGNGRIDTTTWNALYLTERFGIDAPVASGPAAPLVGPAPPPTDFVHGANGLGDIPLPATLRRKADPRPAHRFIIDTVRAHPGEITIVAVGRMTNLALALREDPAIAGLVREIVIMGGAFGHNGFHGNVTPVAEANIHGDPLAADEVFGGIWRITVVGLDVTQRTQMTTDYLRALARDGGEAGRFIWDITRFYVAFHHAAGVADMFVHDSSAVAYLIDPSLFTTRRGSIRVVTDGIATGQTMLKPDEYNFPPGPWDDRPSHAVCIDVDTARLLSLYRDTITAA